jgi:hypothetical protein
MRRKLKIKIQKDMKVYILITRYKFLYESKIMLSIQFLIKIIILTFLRLIEVEK